MFSRLRVVANKAGFAQRHAASLGQGFKTSAIRASAGSVQHETKEEKGVIAEYGYVPFFGLAAAAMISKEVFHVDAETLLALDVVAFSLAAYIASGDMVSKMVEEDHNATLTKYNKGFDALLNSVSIYKNLLQFKFQEVDVMKELVDEQHDAAVAFCGYQNAKIRHAAYSEMVSKLEAIKAREDAEASAEITKYVDGVLADVYSAFDGEKGAALRTEALDFAIANIGQKPTAQDPVSKLFLARKE